MTPSRLLNNLLSINVADLEIEAASLNEKELVDLQQMQMREGSRGDGKRTRKYRNKVYVDKFKKSSTSLPYMDYYLTGDFYKDMFAKAESGKIFFGSFDEKSNKPEKEEDNKLFGLSKEYKVKEILVIKRDFVKLFKDAITR